MNIPATERFVAANFKLRKCRRYVKVDLTKGQLTPNEKRMFRENDCVCGNSLEWHVQNGIDGQFVFGRRSWSIEDDTGSYPCDTFGELKFVAGDGVDSNEILPGASAKYIRLDGRTDDADYLDAVYELLTGEQYWGIRKPGLVMEITGSTSDFPYIDQITIDKFNEGLLKAARSSNAWIVTNGIDRGVMKLVGEAVAEGRMAHIDCNVICLGIGSWGTVKYRDSLVPNKRESSGASTGCRSPNLKSKSPRPVRSGDQTAAFAHGKWAVEYFIDTKDANGTMALEHNHNYFLLVDNGRDKRFGEEIAFRARLIDHISKKEIPGSDVINAADSRSNETSTPSLLIVIGGGETALKTVEETLSTFNPENNQTPRPVIVLPGFGGTADIIAYAYEITETKTQEFNQGSEKKRKPKLASQKSLGGRKNNNKKESSFPDDFDKRVLEHPEMEWLLRQTPEDKRAAKTDHYLNVIRACVSQRKLITVVDLFAENIGSKEPLDRDILQSIFKAELQSPAVMLELAQSWNRPDFAKAILDEYAHQIKKTMNCHEAMLRAISNGQSAFCKLFDDYNLVDTRKFVTRKVMAEIYDRVFVKKTTNVRKGYVTLFRRFLSKHTALEKDDLVRSQDLLKIVGDILATQIGCYVDNLFTEPIVEIIGKSREENENAELENDDGGDATIALPPDLHQVSPLLSQCVELTALRTPHVSTVEHAVDPLVVPYLSGMRDLFLFSLIIGAKDMSLNFWFSGQDLLGTALFAAKFLQTLSEYAERSGLVDLAGEYDKFSNSWEKRAIDLLTVCYDDNPARANRLLTRSLTTWQNYSVLDIAFHSDQQEFMGHPAVQTKLNQLWYGRIAPFSKTRTVYLSAFCFPIVDRVQFVSKPTKKPAANNKDDLEQVTNTSTIEKTCKKPRFASVSWTSFHETEKSIPFFRAIGCIYSSPKIKFLSHSLTTFLSLLAFSYFIVSGPNANYITPLEVYIWAWSFVTFADLVRESLGEELLNNYSETFAFFFAQAWNWIDVIAEICLLSAFAMRFAVPVEYYAYPRTAYSLTCLFYWMKSFRVLYVSQVLGPKVITLFKMLHDLFFFLVLYLIILISFSLPIYVLMFPNRVGADNFVATVGRLFYILYARWWNLVGISIDEGRQEVEGTCPAPTASTFSPNEADNSTANVAEKQESKNGDCSERNVVGIALFVVFLILTNVMLFNMLIAMLTHTVDAVRERAIRLWRFHIYRMTYEFYWKPVLAPPFSIFEMIYRLIQQMRFAVYLQRKSSGLKEYFSPNDFDYQTLSLFERSSAVDLVEAESDEAEETSKSAILVRLKMVHQRLYHKLDKVEEKIGDLAARQAHLHREMSEI